MQYDFFRGIRLPSDFLTVSKISAFASALSFLPDADSFVIGCDNRSRSLAIRDSLTESLLRLGKRVVDVGVLTTPALSVCTCKLGADYGVMVTGGSSSPRYNGFKIFESNGCSLDLSNVSVLNDFLKKPPSLSNRFGFYYREDGVSVYCRHIEEKADFSFNGKEVFLDVANGAGLPIAERLFTRFDGDIRFLTFGLGENVNRRCGAAHPHFLQKQKCALAFAIDGDGDRGCAACENRLFSEEEMLFYLAEFFRFPSAVCGFPLSSSEKFLSVPSGEAEKTAFIKSSPFAVERGGKYLFSAFGHTFDGILFALSVTQADCSLPLRDFNQS